MNFAGNYPFQCVTDVDPAVLQRFVLVDFLLCSGRLPGGENLCWDQVLLCFASPSRFIITSNLPPVEDRTEQVKKNPKKTEKHPYSFSSMCKMLFCPFLSLLALSEELFDDTIIAAHVPLLSCQSSMFVSFFDEETKKYHPQETDLQLVL